MTNAELAKIITVCFTPLAFACNCKGEHADCAETLNDRGAWIQYDTVARIARYIESLDKQT